MSVTTDHLDIWEMLVVHRMFRREFRLAPGLITAVADGDHARAAGTGEFYLYLVNGLHLHHTGEDEMLWPRLMQRVGALDSDLVRRMQTQHERLAVLLAHIGELLPGWRDRADAATRDELAAVFVQASTAIDEHLTEEENEILPLVSQHITHAEWEAFRKRAQESLPKTNTVFVFLGAILEDATPAERAAFLTLLPTPLRLAWYLFGRRIHRRAMTRLRGAA